MESFFQISNFWPETEHFQKNKETWILIKLQCVMYQWIRFNELYKLMESSFKISESFFESVTNFKNNSGIGLMQVGGGGICAEQHAFYLIFAIIFRANLSNDYFTNRQDRYWVIEDSAELCDFFCSVVETISKHSFQLQKDNTVSLSPGATNHPYEVRSLAIAEGNLFVLTIYLWRQFSMTDKIMELFCVLPFSKNDSYLLNVLWLLNRKWRIPVHHECTVETVVISNFQPVELNISTTNIIRVNILNQKNAEYFV